MTTERQRAARRANGRLGGRPDDVTGEQARARELARRLGRKAVPSAVRLWTRLVAGRVRGATMSDRVRAAENLADRFGAPRRAEADLAVSDAPPKLFDLGPWPEPESQAVPVPPDAITAPDAEPLDTVRIPLPVEWSEGPPETRKEASASLNGGAPAPEVKARAPEATPRAVQLVSPWVMRIVPDDD